MGKQIAPTTRHASVASVAASDAPDTDTLAPVSDTPLATPPDEAAVVLEDVSKQFGKQDVLHNINIRVPWGEILGLIGPSGSGKTTTIRMMLGMLKPSGGHALTFGRDPMHLRRADRERIGYMPQDFVLYPALTVQENLRFAASLYGVSWWEARRRVRELLPFVDLTEARRRRAEDLSGGMRRRLSLAATLMHDPDFLVLDEPTAGIDPILRASIWDGLRQARTNGKTMVITTQYVTEAEYCDSVILIDEGTIIASGPPDELRRDATGGEMVDIRLAEPRPDIAARLRSLPFVHAVELLDRPDEVRVVVDDIEAAIPELRAYFDREEGGATSIEAHVLSFDDVFVRLVSRARAAGKVKERDGGDTHTRA